MQLIMGNRLQAHRLKPALTLILLFIGSLIRASGGVATFASIPAAYGFNVPGTLSSGTVTMTLALTRTNTLVISWPSPSTGFTLQQNSNVGTTNWTNVAQTPGDNGTTMSVVVPASPGSKFYRLKN